MAGPIAPPRRPMCARAKVIKPASRSTCARRKNAPRRCGCRASRRHKPTVRSKRCCCAPPANNLKCAKPVVPSLRRERSEPLILRGPLQDDGMHLGSPIVMMSDADRNKAADILMKAEKERKQAVALTKTWPDITMEDAYAISTEVADRKIAAGAKLIGHKVGLTSKAMQRSSQIDEPDYGPLLDTMMIADGARVPHENFCLPRVEVELAFVLGKPLQGPGVGLTDVLRATEYVVPAIEVVDARLQDPRKIFDTVSDNGAAAGIVVGGRPVGPLEVDLRWVGGIMYRNSGIEEAGVAAGVLGHPALGVAWLANKLGQHGVPLEVGHLVLAGSFTRVVFARKGDTLHADFGSLGGIALQFV